MWGKCNFDFLVISITLKREREKKKKVNDFNNH